MSKRSDIRIALEKFLRQAEGKSGTGMVRDQRRRPILIPEALIDFEKIARSDRPFLDFGRRIRILRDGPRASEEVYVVPAELCQISREEPASLAGADLPFGTVLHDEGLWLRLAPGYREIGVSDRGDVVIRFDPEAAKDSAAGPVPNSVNTSVLGRSERFVARFTTVEHQADRREAEAWLRSLALVGGGKTLKSSFKCAGLDVSYSGNNPHLHRTLRLGFFDVRDSEMLRIESLLRLRFRKVRREVPRLSVCALMGIPRDQAAYAAFCKKLKGAKKDPVKLGLPGKLSESRFYDPARKGIVPSSFALFGKLTSTPQEIAVVTVNADSYGDVKSRGVLASLASALAPIDVISARASVAVLSKAGTATSFMGATGSGKSTAAVFWTGKSEKDRRQELRRRYEMELRRTPDAGRLGEIGIEKELDRIMDGVGILCQEDWVEILKEGAGHWVFWPTERAVYARTSHLPGLIYALSENDPLLENAAADFGGSGNPSELGRINHQCASERVFYDPDWNHIRYDRSPRQISVMVVLDRDPESDLVVRKLTAREAVDRLLLGRTSEGGNEPLCNVFNPVSALLTQIGVVGDALLSAYDSARRGEYGPLGAGDGRLGEMIFDSLDTQLKLWLDCCREVPVFAVNISGGHDMTQDVHWLLSERPDLFDGWRQVGRADFRRHMLERYGVSYGPSGDWTHIPRGRPQPA